MSELVEATLQELMEDHPSCIESSCDASDSATLGGIPKSVRVVRRVMWHACTRGGDGIVNKHCFLWEIKY